MPSASKTFKGSWVEKCGREDIDQDVINTNVASFSLCNRCSSLFEKLVGGHRQAKPDALTRSWNPD